MTKPDHGWQLVQLAELLRTIEEHGDIALRALRGLDTDLDEDAVLTVPCPELDDVRAVVVEIAQLAERAEQIAELLARDDDVEIAYSEVADAAAADLAAGILDGERARLAFRLLPAATGWRVLADALRSADVHGAWEDVTIADALGAFRGATREQVEQVAATAGLTPATEIATCGPGEIARLAAALDEHAPGP